jgi:hypothetical protein
VGTEPVEADVPIAPLVNVVPAMLWAVVEVVVLAIEHASPDGGQHGRR